MKASELRIGNWVDISYKNDEQDQHQVTGITERGAVWFVPDPSSLECAFSINQIKPIPLTEEWLERLSVGGETFADVFTIWDRGGKISIEQYGEGDYELTHIKHVHSLQNLYHALTGEELTLKQKAK